MLIGICATALGLAVIVVGFLFASGDTTPPTPPRTDVLPQPKVKKSKSLSDLKAGQFYLRRDPGSDLCLAIGDIENVSLNLHRDVKAKLELLDKNGAVIGSLTQVIVEFSPGAVWHVVANVTNANVMDVRLDEITEPR